MYNKRDYMINEAILESMFPENLMRRRIAGGLCLAASIAIPIGAIWLATGGANSELKRSIQYDNNYREDSPITMEKTIIHYNKPPK